MSTNIDKICDALLAAQGSQLDPAARPVAQEAIDLIRGLEADALRFRKLSALLQSAYDGSADVVEAGELSVYCSMLSGWRNERTVKAEIIWRDERDADLDLAGALDKINLGGLEK